MSSPSSCHYGGGASPERITGLYQQINGIGHIGQVDALSAHVFVDRGDPREQPLDALLSQRPQSLDLSLRVIHATLPPTTIPSCKPCTTYIRLPPRMITSRKHSRVCLTG